MLDESTNPQIRFKDVFFLNIKCQQKFSLSTLSANGSYNMVSWQLTLAEI